MADSDRLDSVAGGVIAGFVAAAGLFVLGGMIAAVLGFIDVEEGRRALALRTNRLYRRASFQIFGRTNGPAS